MLTKTHQRQWQRPKFRFSLYVLLSTKDKNDHATQILTWNIGVSSTCKIVSSLDHIISELPETKRKRTKLESFAVATRMCAHFLKALERERKQPARQLSTTKLQYLEAYDKMAAHLVQSEFAQTRLSVSPNLGVEVLRWCHHAISCSSLSRRFPWRIERTFDPLTCFSRLLASSLCRSQSCSSKTENHS